MDTTTPEKQADLSPEELQKLDSDLLEMEILYKSRCVKMPPFSNVTVREIDESK